MKKYSCSKCSHHEFELGQVRAAGGFWSKIFDIQGAKFTTVTCQKCKYTEMYKGSTKTIENVLDFLTN